MKKTCLAASLAAAPLCLLLVASSNVCVAQEPITGETATIASPLPAKINTPSGWELFIENDSLAFGEDHTDRFYTSGLRAKYTFADLRRGKVNAGPGFMDKIVNGLLKRSVYRQRSIAFGQNLYTPSDVTVPALIANDRPYAGWLYGSIIWTGYRPTNVRKPDNGAARRRDRNESVGIDIGVTGPWSFAEPTQREFHNFIGSRTPRGWGNQLKNEVGIILSYQHNRRPIFIGSTKTFGLDVTTNAGADVGNIFTQAKVGAVARFGYNVPRDFHASTIISPTLAPQLAAMKNLSSPDTEGETATNDAQSTRRRGKNPFSFYVYGGAEGRAVARNIFLDGNTFRSSHSVSKKYFVNDLKAGAAAHVGRFHLSYTLVRRSPEFKERNERHIFGSFNIGWGDTF